MKESYSKAYADAGVNIEAGYEGVERIKKHVLRTRIPGVLSGIGGFGGLFEPDLSGYEHPVFVSGTDGVGTKIRIAQLLGRHDTVGIDCVAMCVNDIICCGAKPLFFLDYIAIGKNDPSLVESIVSGVADGCEQAGCALIGGETAEHPGLMQPEEYDLAGFSVGIADRDRMLHPGLVQRGDVLLALPSSGLHSNGFSLVRKVLDVENADLSRIAGGCGISLGDLLLTPTRIYVRPVLAVLAQVPVHGISHITGGGFYENIPRSIPEGLSAVIESSAVRVPEIFRLIQHAGGISTRDMFNTFNMGVGMTMTVPAADADTALSVLKASGCPDAYVLGEIGIRPERVVLC